MGEDSNVYGAPSEAAQAQALFPAEEMGEIAAAGFGIRAGARIIDTILGLVLGFGAGVLVGLVAVALAAGGSLTVGWQHRLGAFNGGSLAIGLLGPIAYHTIAEWMGGASLGKALCGLRVRRADMSPCGFGGALVRSMAYFIDALFCGLVAYGVMSNSRWQQRLGDKWGNTIVVEAASLRQKAGQLPGAGGGIAIGMVVWLGILFLSNLIKVF